MHHLTVKLFSINKIIIYDTNDCQKVCEFKEAHRRGVYSAIYDNDDQVLTGGGDAFIKIWRSNKYIK